MAIELGSVQGATEEVKDYTGGGSFIWETDVHEVTIKHCYCVVANSGAQAFHWRFENTNGKEYKEDAYFVGKNGGFTYPVKKDGKPTGKTRHTPGFSMCASIVACAFPESFKEFIADESNGKTPTERYENFFVAACASCEPGTVQKWDWDLKKDVLTEAEDVMKNIIGKKISLSIQTSLVNGQSKNSKGDYVNVAGDDKEVNSMQNAFTVDGFSAAEMMAGVTEPVIMEGWIKNNKGKVRDARKIKDGGTTGGQQSGNSGNQPSKTKNMFS